ncbi:hypothetical protein T265_07044 [Opisthorchis viverrini]|uniref:Uncharacterized protein n=1 Tax=Opisthorchis viverrini TaxID=6198 RepID=A0A074ZQC1_OPIVI|nr:hypothetical protein T265_07044 [Opisthorchis viverrini]KER25530.1 hypothetical protein T265_07044 [Opisthorchis viverrini]
MAVTQVLHLRKIRGTIHYGRSRVCYRYQNNVYRDKCCSPCLFHDGAHDKDRVPVTPPALGWRHCKKGWLVDVSGVRAVIFLTDSLTERLKVKVIQNACEKPAPGGHLKALPRYSKRDSGKEFVWTTFSQLIKCWGDAIHTLSAWNMQKILLPPLKGRIEAQYMPRGHLKALPRYSKRDSGKEFVWTTFSQLIKCWGDAIHTLSAWNMQKILLPPLKGRIEAQYMPTKSNVLVKKYFLRCEGAYLTHPTVISTSVRRTNWTCGRHFRRSASQEWNLLLWKTISLCASFTKVGIRLNSWEDCGIEVVNLCLSFVVADPVTLAVKCHHMVITVSNGNLSFHIFSKISFIGDNRSHLSDVEFDAVVAVELVYHTVLLGFVRCEHVHHFRRKTRICSGSAPRVLVTRSPDTSDARGSNLAHWHVEQPPPPPNGCSRTVCYLTQSNFRRFLIQVVDYDGLDMQKFTLMIAPSNGLYAHAEFLFRYYGIVGHKETPCKILTILQWSPVSTSWNPFVFSVRSIFYRFFRWQIPVVVDDVASCDV